MKTDMPCSLIGKRAHIAVTFLLFLISRAGFCDIIPPSRIITWQGNIGIPGGVPTNRVIFTNMSAGATMTQIQSALNTCPSNKIVMLPAGTNNIAGVITIPSYVTLCGAGAGVTILNLTGSSSGPPGGGAVEFGTPIDGEFVGTVHNITSGCTKGSTNIVLDSVSGISAGTLLVLDELNDTNLVNVNGVYGTPYVSRDSPNHDLRAIGQTVEVQSVSGTTVTFWPPMFMTYSNSLSPQVVSYSAGCQWAGLENLTLRANNSGYVTMFDMTGSKYCWVKNIEDDFADNDHGELWFSFRCEVRDSYFHDGYRHGSGTSDTDVMLSDKTSSCLVENNIFYRLHGSVIIENGASGNVVGYNYSFGNFDSGSTNVLMQSYAGCHGAHPIFNLFEGNYGGEYHPDSYLGSSSHGTALRNWFTGDNIIYPPAVDGRVTVLTNSGYHASQGLGAVILDYSESYYNIVGNIVGCPWASATNGAIYMTVAPANISYSGVSYLYKLGYADVSDTGGASQDSTLPYTTLLNHGNYDFVSGTQKWDATIADTNIPNSYYLSAKPSWFGSLTWPPFNPANPAAASMTNIPAGYRFVFGVNPPASGSAPEFQTVTNSESTLKMVWSATVGDTYQMLYKTNLDQTNWNYLGAAVIATNAVMTMPDAIGPDRQRFYRVMMVSP